MPVFDGKVKTQTRVGIAGDRFSPAMGLLVGSSFKEDVFNHGTLNQLVTGDITRTYAANEVIKIAGNQNQIIAGNQMEIIAGVTTRVHTGLLMQTMVGGEMTVCVGPYNRTDVASVTWLCPTATMINSGDLFETKIQKCGAYAFRFTGIGADVTIRMSKTDISVNATDVKAIETKLKTLQNKLLAGLKNRAAALCIAIEAARSDIKGIHPEVRAARPAVGIELSVPPDTLPGIQ